MTGWVIPGKKKKAADSVPFEDEGTPAKASKNVTTRRPGAKERLRGKAHGVQDPAPKVSKANPVQKTPQSREDSHEDPEDDEEETRTAAPKPVARPPFVGSPVRDEDGVSQGYSHISEEEARGSEKPTKKDVRKGKARRIGGEGRKEKTEEGRNQVEDGTLYTPQATAQIGENGQNTGFLGVLEAEKGQQINATLSPVIPTSVQVALEQRRPLPILQNRGIDQNAEAIKVKSLPRYACSTCSMGPECPEFNEGYVCAFEAAFDAFPVRDADSVISLMGEIVDTNKKRWRMALLQERISSGGMADPNVTRLSEVVMSQAQGLVDLQQEVNKVTVSVTGHAETVGNEAPKAVGGILSKLFGGGGVGNSPVLQAPAPTVVLDMNPINPELAHRGMDDRALMAAPIEGRAPGEAPTGSNEALLEARGLVLQKLAREESSNLRLSEKDDSIHLDKKARKEGNATEPKDDSSHFDKKASGESLESEHKVNPSHPSENKDEQSEYVKAKE